ELAVTPHLAEVLDRDPAPDDRAAPDRDVLAHRAQVGHQHLGVDRRAAVQHHAGADDAVVAEAECRKLLLLGGGRVGGPHRKLAQRRVVVDAHLVADRGVGMDHHQVADATPRPDPDVGTDHAALPDHGALAEHGGGIDDAGAGLHDTPAFSAAIATGAPPASSEAWAALSTRTTRRPSSPSVSGVLRSRTQSRKCWHSSRSGSWSEILGITMSPMRTVSASP